MKIYRAEGYFARNGNMADSTFLILNDKERFDLAYKLVKLIDDLTENKPPKWNALDHEMIVFLSRCCHYFQGGEMLDPTVNQLVKVNKMLRKLYRPSFIDWLTLEHEGEIKDRDEMFKWMERKRRVKKKYEDGSLLQQFKKIVENNQFIDWM